MRPVVTAQEMRAAEQRFVERGGDLEWLMRQAGMQVAARVPTDRSVLILAGPGNNGGDALIAGSIIRERGDDVRMYVYKRREEVPHATRAEDDPDCTQLAAELERADVVVDGLLGIGRKRPVEGELAEIIERANRSSALRISVDLPTGVDSDSGQVETVAFDADLTVTLGWGKRGLWGSPGADTAGRLEIADIGMPPGSAEGTSTSLLDAGDISPLLPRRTKEWNKGKSGRLLVVSGSENYSGAPTLVSVAAYRAGAGLVDLAVPDVVRPIVAGRDVEAVFTPVDSEKAMGPESVESVIASAEKAKAIAMGPGLGSEDATVAFVREALTRLKEVGKPMVLDADGLNAVAKWDRWWDDVPRDTVITPHPGEMGRLLDCSVEEVQADRFTACEEAVRRFGVAVVLKGSNSLIGLPGQAGGSPSLRICPLGGPNLGTAGTGDVLTGIIGGLLAQGLSPADAATAGVWIHAQCGERLRDRLGDAGTLASDLWAEIPLVRKDLEAGTSRL